MSAWNPDLPFCALILFLIFLMYAIPSAIEGIHNYHRGTALARQLYKERDKPQLFDQDRDDWK